MAIEKNVSETTKILLESESFQIALNEASAKAAISIDELKNSLPAGKELTFETLQEAASNYRAGLILSMRASIESIIKGI